MRLSDRASVYIFAVLLNAALITFGMILIVQGAIHKMSAGEAVIRDAVVARATEPLWFWFSVGFDAVVGAALVIGGCYGFWLTFRRKPPSADRDNG